MAAATSSASSASACSPVSWWPTSSRSSPGPPARRTRPRCARTAAATEPSRSPIRQPASRAGYGGVTAPRYRAPMVPARQRRRVRERFRRAAGRRRPHPRRGRLAEAAAGKLTTNKQLAWCRERFGFEAMGIIPLESTSADVTGLAFAPPYTERAGHRTGDRIYSKGTLVADRNDLIVPRRPLLPRRHRRGRASAHRGARAGRHISRARCSSPASGSASACSASSSSCTACTPTSSTRSSRCTPRD